MPSIHALQAELGRVAFLGVVLLVLVGVLLFIASTRRLGAARTAALVARVGLIVTLVGVGSLTLFGWLPPSEANRILILDPLQGMMGWERIAWRPVVDNVAMFVPVGALATAVWWRRSVWAVWLGCVALSVGIEAFQYLVPTGRVANAADVVANAAGALVGVTLATALGVRRGPGRRVAPRPGVPASRAASHRDR